MELAYFLGCMKEASGADQMDLCLDGVDADWRDIERMQTGSWQQLGGVVGIGYFYFLELHFSPFDE